MLIKIKEPRCLIFFIYCFTFFTCEKLSLEKYQLTSINPPWPNYTKIDSGSFGEVYRSEIEGLENLAFKYINLRKHSNKKLSQFEANLRCFYNKQSIKQEISVNDHLESFSKLKGGFSFKNYLTHFEGQIEAEKDPCVFVLVFERLQSDATRNAFDKYFINLNYALRLWVYLNFMKSVFVLHSLGVNHCDLKPGNFAVPSSLDLCNSDSAVQAKPIDFGKANFNLYCREGTEGYSYPQIDELPKTEPVDPEDTRYEDIYSLAATLMAFEVWELNREFIDLPKALQVYEYLKLDNTDFLRSLKEQFLNLIKEMALSRANSKNLQHFMSEFEKLIQAAAVALKINLEEKGYEPVAKWIDQLKNTLKLKEANKKGSFVLNAKPLNIKIESKIISSESLENFEDEEDVAEEIETNSVYNVKEDKKSILIPNFSDFAPSKNSKPKNERPESQKLKNEHLNALNFPPSNNLEIFSNLKRTI